MRRILLWILLFAAAIQVSGQEARKPYHNKVVTVTSTSVNANGVRLIFAKNSQYSFKFTCNADSESCKTSLIGSDYQLLDDSPFRAYECDEYRMLHGDGDWCRVCLHDVDKTAE